MAEGWQPGDLALCVNGKGWSRVGTTVRIGGPSPGSVTVVEAVRVFPSGVVALQFDAWPLGWYLSGCFRRIPPHARDAEDDETIRLLTGAPERVAA